MAVVRRANGSVALTAGVLAILVVWALGARLIGAEIILPGPVQTVRELYLLVASAPFYGHLLATLVRSLGGFAAAFFVGLGWGLLGGLVRPAGRSLAPSLVLIRSTPVIAIILLALIWFPATVAPVFVTWLMVVPLVVENVVTGVRTASGRLREMAEVYQVPRGRKVRELTLPALRPYLFASAHAGLGMAFKVTVAAEVIVQPARALGGAMQEARFYLDTPRILALTLAVIALSALTEAVLRGIERLAPGVHRGPRAITGEAQAATALVEQQHPEMSGVAVSAITRRFGSRVVIDHLSLTFNPGEVTVVLGPSGCGKTTLLRLISKIDTPESGRVDLPGPVSMVFQEPRLLPWADASGNVAFVLPRGAGWHRIGKALAEASLPAHGAALPDTLSGGMQQRLALARALAYRGRVLLLDEPFQNLDLAVKLDLARRVRKVTEGRVTIMVTHDVVEALAAGDRIVIMAGEPARIVGEERVELSAEARDPRSPEYQRLAARLYDLLLAPGRPDECAGCENPAESSGA